MDTMNTMNLMNIMDSVSHSTGETNAENKTEHISDNMQDLCESIIRLIYSNNNSLVSKDDIDNIVKTVLPNINKKFQIVAKRRNRKLIPKNEMCMGRKLDYKQCTRRRMNGTDYCRSHLRKLPNGRIDQEMPISRVKAKRGRKRKVEFDPKQSDPNYITLWEDIIDGERRLVDMSGNVYSFDTVHPRYLGKKSLDGKIE